jgi:hypothetical protein
MDLRATLAVVAEFLPVVGVPEMVVYDNLFEEVDLGTIDEPLRQILLARRGTYEVTGTGMIIRRLGRFGIRLYAEGGVTWTKDRFVCRGGDLPAFVHPLRRAWLSYPGDDASAREGLWTYHVRPNGLPNDVGPVSISWREGDGFDSILSAFLSTREMVFTGRPPRRMTDEEFDAYSRMHRECMTSRTE